MKWINGFMNINNEQEKKRAELFMQRDEMVHVSKKDGIFLNGNLLEIADDFFVLLDYIQQKEYFIFYSELKKPLEIFRNKTEVDSKESFKIREDKFQ